MMRTTKVGTSFHVEEKISPEKKVVAIVDAIGRGGIFLRRKIDGGWYYSPLEWDRCEEKRSVYPVLVDVYRHLRRRQITRQSLHQLVRMRTSQKPLN